MDPNTEVVSLVLDDGSVIRVQATTLGSWQDVVDTEKTYRYEELANTIENVSRALSGTLARVKPKKATVKFGLEIGVEAGGLTAFLVKGSATGNLEVTLEFSGPS